MSVIRTLGVLGAGQMGTGIALVAALRAKVPVLLHDRSPEQMTKGLALMDKLLAKDVAKGRLTSEQSKEARDLVSVVSGEEGIRGLRDVDMVVEVGVLLTRFRNMSYTLEYIGSIGVFATQAIYIRIIRRRA